MGTRLMITSGKGGAGKSSVCVALSAALARRGLSVLLVDLDEGLRSLDLLVGAGQDIVFDLADVLSGRCTVGQAARRVFGLPGFFLLAAPLYNGILEGETLSGFAKAAAARFDVVMLDCPAGLDRMFAVCAEASSEAILVASTEPAALRSAVAAANALVAANLPSKLLINAFSRKHCQAQICAGVDEAVDCTGLPLIGVVPYDLAVREAGAKGMPLHRKSHAAKAFARVAARMDGQSVPLPPMNRI